MSERLTKDLKPGSFYWVVIVLDPDTDEEWENRCMPARYVGDGKWQYLSQEGASDWPVRWVGPELIPPH